MKNESEVWTSFRKHLPTLMFARRIEDYQNSGTWDCVLNYEGRGAWIEFKHTETVKRKPELRKGQYAFGWDLFKAAANGLYVVGSTDGGVRVLGQLYDGEDWRKSLIKQYKIMEKATVQDILEMLELGV